MDRQIAVIDMKSFYAFVECVERGLNPFTTPLAVCDPTRGDGTVVMSVSPFLKEMGVPSVCRRRELPNVPGMVLAQPRMSLYIKKSAEIINIVLNHVGEDDIHVYSIDEFFVNVGLSGIPLFLSKLKAAAVTNPAAALILVKRALSIIEIIGHMREQST